MAIWLLPFECSWSSSASYKTLDASIMILNLWNLSGVIYVCFLNLTLIKPQTEKQDKLIRIWKCSCMTTGIEFGVPMRLLPKLRTAHLCTGTLCARTATVSTVDQNRNMLILVRTWHKTRRSTTADTWGLCQSSQRIQRKAALGQLWQVQQMWRPVCGCRRHTVMSVLHEPRNL